MNASHPAPRSQAATTRRQPSVQPVPAAPAAPPATPAAQDETPEAPAAEPELPPVRPAAPRPVVGPAPAAGAERAPAPPPPPPGPGASSTRPTPPSAREPLDVGLADLFPPPPPAAAVFPPAALHDRPADHGPGLVRTPSARRGRRVAAVVAGGAALVLMGSAAQGAAHKTVTLDVNGRITTVATYAGSVERLLSKKGVVLRSADLLTPAGSEALRDGALVVVRTRHEVTVEIDGERRAVRVAALDADEALARFDHLADPDARVRLLPDRDGDRAVLPLRLDTAGPVWLVADGRTRTVPDGGALLDDVLAKAGVTLSDDDRVHVFREPPVAPGSPTVRVVVQRVVTQDVTTVSPVPFETITREDPAVYADLPPRTVQDGVPGERTRVDAVTTVDGVEESRTLVSDGVTRLPVPQILVVGTATRPVEEPETAPPAAVVPQPAQPATSPVPATVPAVAGWNWAWAGWDTWGGWGSFDRHRGDRHDRDGGRSRP